MILLGILQLGGPSFHYKMRSGLIADFRGAVTCLNDTQLSRWYVDRSGANWARLLQSGAKGIKGTLFAAIGAQARALVVSALSALLLSVSGCELVC